MSMGRKDYGNLIFKCFSHRKEKISLVIILCAYYRKYKQSVFVQLDNNSFQTPVEKKEGVTSFAESLENIPLQGVTSITANDILMHIFGYTCVCNALGIIRS